MARNIEIKARVKDLEALKNKVAPLADQGPTEIVQDDTFFVCPNGRLKLRTFSEKEGTLVFYQRPDQEGPKESFYLLSQTDAPDALRALLTAAYGTCGRVRKVRTLYMVGRTRVHLDRVEGLGDFMELEVVLRENETAEDGVTEAHALMATLGISPDALIDGAYVDLLAKK